MFEALPPRKALAAAVLTGLVSMPAWAQETPAPRFSDERRLPDANVQRRDLENLLEEERLRKKQTSEPTVTGEGQPAAEKRRADGIAETQRKAEEAIHKAYEAEVKAAQDRRIADGLAETQRKANETMRNAYEAEVKAEITNEAQLNRNNNLSVANNDRGEVDKAQLNANQAMRNAYLAEEKAAEATRASSEDAARKAEKERTAAQEAKKKAMEAERAEAEGAAERKAQRERHEHQASKRPPGRVAVAAYTPHHHGAHYTHEHEHKSEHQGGWKRWLMSVGLMKPRRDKK